MKNIKIEKVVRLSEHDKIVVILENEKQVLRKLYRDNLTEISYFKFKNCEYYLNKLHLYNIQVVDDI